MTLTNFSRRQKSGIMMAYVVLANFALRLVEVNMDGLLSYAVLAILYIPPVVLLLTLLTPKPGKIFNQPEDGYPDEKPLDRLPIKDFMAVYSPAIVSVLLTDGLPVFGVSDLNSAVTGLGVSLILVVLVYGVYYSDEVYDSGVGNANEAANRDETDNS